LEEILSIEFFGGLIAAILTIMVLSYLIGDNPLFRTATHTFIGISAGYAGTIALHSIIKPNLIDPFIAAGSEGILNGAVFAGANGRFLVGAWILIFMLLLKLSPSTSTWGSLPMILLVSVGAGVVVGGALTGTLIPQSINAMESLNPSGITTQTGETGFERVINVIILLIGTLSTVLYFQFTAKRGPTGEGQRSTLMAVIAYIGRIFIAITFGTMYAGVLMASLIALSERIESLGTFIGEIVAFF
jgi:hypothetical protein